MWVLGTVAMRDPWGMISIRILPASRGSCLLGRIDSRNPGKASPLPQPLNWVRYAREEGPPEPVPSCADRARTEIHPTPSTRADDSRPYRARSRLLFLSFRPLVQRLCGRDAV